MSSPSTPRSGDTHASSLSALQDYPPSFAQHDTLQRPIPTSRYPPRRGSTASSICSIGGMLDTSLTDRGLDTSEAGHNGEFIALRGCLPLENSSTRSSERNLNSYYVSLQPYQHFSRPRSYAPALCLTHLPQPPAPTSHHPLEIFLQWH